MNKIVQLFGNDTVLNDSKVLWFVKTHFRVGLNQPSLVSALSNAVKKVI